MVFGEFHDQGDAKWIVIRGPLRGHNDTPFGRPTPGRPIGRPGVGHPQGVFGVFSYYKLVMLFLNMVCLTVALVKSHWIRGQSLKELLDESKRVKNENIMDGRSVTQRIARGGCHD